MTVIDKINGRKIGIVGMARSGMSAAALAVRFGGKPFVSDSNSADNLHNQISLLQNSGIPFETDGHTDKLLTMDYLVVSPGVPLTVDILQKASEQGIPVFSEIEFASWACKGTIVAVTGSNGKTTTTTLIGEIFTAAGFDTFVGGNIGFPFSEFVMKMTEKSYAVVEVSNFQLETISDFAPDTALILNLTPDHLDRHGTFENYKKAKFRITENQTEHNWLILNRDDKETNQSQISTKAKKLFFTSKESDTAGAYVKNNILCVKQADSDASIIPIDEIKIPGPHNLQNAAAAALTASRYDISPDITANVLRTFAGVEHRLEKAGRIAGVNFINDSKATNVDSVCYALQSVDTPVYLIAGGRDKDSDFNPIIEYGRNKIKGIIAIGEAKEKLADTLAGSFPVQFAESLQSAVELGFELAIPGETVLLSPGCASFDMFENFEQRGNVFKEAVKSLKNGKDTNEPISS